MTKSLILLHCGLLSFFMSAAQRVDPADNPNPQNVLFIAVDDMNNFVNALGGPAKTPNIDRLAKRGRLFTNAHTVVPACNPSRVAVMTGLRPETTQQYANAGNFREKPNGANWVSLGQFLQNKGYETVAAGKIFHKPRGSAEVANPQSDPQSWSFQPKNYVGTGGHDLYLDEYDQASWLEGAMREEVTTGKAPSYLSKFGVWGVTPEKKEETNDWKNAVFGKEYLSKKHNKPFFLAIGIFRPHSPQLAPQEFFDLYPLEEVMPPKLPNDDMQDIPQSAKTNFSSEFVGHVKNKKQLQKAMQGYLASISFADACIGQVLDGLEQGPNKENTLVVLWTDHGWQLGHKDRWEKFSLWRQATHVPLIIDMPGLNQRGTPTDEAVSLLDLYPTVTELLGYGIPKQLEGESLVPLLRKPSAKREKPAIITYPKNNHSVQDERYNYIRYADGSQELYDHKNDLTEYKNLASDPAYAKKMQEMAAWLDNL